MKVIAEWQGHKDGGKLILQTYSHVNPVHSNRMAQLMTDDEPENVVPMRGASRTFVSIKSIADHKARIARAET